MPMIEGFGDEVTYAMMVMLAVIVIMVCWLSTQLRFIPFVNVFVLESMQDLIFTNIHPSTSTVHVTPEVPVQINEPHEQVSPLASTEVQNAEASSSETPKDESNLVEGTDKESENNLLASNSADESQVGSSSADQLNCDLQSTGATAAGQREKKEKQVKIKLMYLNNTQRVVDAYLSDTIGVFRQSHFRKELTDNKVVRFIFNGKALGNDTSTLSSYNIKGNSIVHCLITPSRARQNEELGSNRSARETLSPVNEGRRDLSTVRCLYPCLVIIFAIIWYQQLAYEETSMYNSIMPILGVVLFLLAMTLALFRAIRLRAAQHI
ncbi:transmembrane and ubiquitin-like domain-containing protein 1 [Argonauta hians]